jgi:hypothetical protein
MPNNEPIDYEELLNGYQILNSVKAPSHKTHFPYNSLTPDKILFTKKTIELIVAENEDKEGGDIFGDTDFVVKKNGKPRIFIYG